MGLFGMGASSDGGRTRRVMTSTLVELDLTVQFSECRYLSLWHLSQRWRWGGMDRAEEFFDKI